MTSAGTPAATLFTTSGPLFCLEVANNHQGSVEHGTRILEAVSAIAERTGATVWVKLQLRDLRTFVHPADRLAGVDTPLTKHSARFLSTAMRLDDFRTLADRARAVGLKIYASPFDEASVDNCVALGFDVIKVASCSAYDWPLLHRIAATRLPVIVSVGGLSLNETDDVVDFFHSRQSPLALLHCVSAYPTRVEDVQLDQVGQLRARFPDVPIGYSGHEGRDDLDVGALAVARGAMILERHVGIETADVPLNAYSLDPEETERWVRHALRAWTACGFGRSRVAVAGERASLLSLRRGVYARRTIPAGATLTRDDVYLAMPCLEGQFHAGKLHEIVGSFTAMQDIHPNAPIGLSLPQPLPKALRLSTVLGRVQEMLDKARIELATGSTLELSHQYGFDRFDEFGAVIIDVVNRDYCKKLIVQFPGQRHPAHRHEKKEETFQVVSGSVRIALNGGAEKVLRAGDTQLIERGVMHSFWSDEGAIFEEISTTHIRGDSIYDDATISSDPALRKTVLPFT
jgi:sialic acid synthase SpsE/quercetin dioxygenase-like cupin family protein